MLIDTHAHLSHHLFSARFPYLAREEEGFVLRTGPLPQLVQELQAAGIGACVEPAIELGSNQRLLDLAAEYPGFVFPAVGVHPTRTFLVHTVDGQGRRTVERLHWAQRKELETLADRPEVVAIGETGLDYHHPRREQHRLRQKAWFVWQLHLAHQKKLPVILHVREAHRDALDILRRHRNWLHGGVCHCFSGTAQTAAAYTALGLKLGIGGALLENSPRLPALEEAVAQTPLESILLETDAPYVKPSCPGLSSKQVKKARNTGLILPEVARRVAELKGLTPEEVARVTTENAAALFGLGKVRDFLPPDQSGAR